MAHRGPAPPGRALISLYSVQLVRIWGSLGGWSKLLPTLSQLQHSQAMLRTPIFHPDNSEWKRRGNFNILFMVAMGSELRQLPLVLRNMVSGHDGDGMMVGLGDPRGLFPTLVILCFYSSWHIPNSGF